MYLVKVWELQVSPPSVVLATAPKIVAPRPIRLLVNCSDLTVGIPGVNIVCQFSPPSVVFKKSPSVEI